MQFRNNATSGNFERDTQLNILNREISAAQLVQQAAALGAKLIDQPSAVVVAGSFNTNPDEPQFVSEITLRLLENAGFKNVLHGVPLGEEHSELHFAWNGADVAMKCSVVRPGQSQSGLRFSAAVGDSGDRLRDMLAALVVRALDARRGGGGLKASSAIDGDKTVRGRDAAFLCYRLEDGVWHRRRVFLPEQPVSGFTVARNEDDEEIQHLCRVYAAADEEGRRLIRLFAELSVSNALEIPPRT